MSARSWLSRLALLCGGLVVGWLAAEGFARAILGPPPGALPPQLFFSSPNWQRAPGQKWLRYAPRTEIRTVALYGDRVEYDVRFRTNDLGFVDDRDYASPGSAPAGRRYLFVGDSFTAGFHAGDPWVPRLRRRAEQRGEPVEIYNLGVGGVGFRQFPLMLRWASGELAFDRVAFVFIGNDLTRILWRPVELGGRIIVCPFGWTPKRCAGNASWMRVLDDPDEDRGKIRKRALELRSPRDRGIGSRLLRESFVLYALYRNERSVRELGLAKSIDLEGWLSRLPALLEGRTAVFLQIPEKHETARGEYDAELGASITAAGYRYVPLLRECGFERSHYFPVDPHFNRDGYALLEECVGRALDLL